MKFKSIVWRLVTILFTTLFSMGLTVPASAADQPTYGTAVIDGDYGEWDLANDFFAKMYEAGDPGKTHLSTAYLRYDCNSKTMFVLVLDVPEDGFYISKTGDNAWIKIRAIQNSNIVDLTPAYNNNGSPAGTPPESSWVPPNGQEGPDGDPLLVGYEASFQLNPGTYNIEIHVNTTDGRTSSTGKSSNEIQVSVICDDTPPDPSIDIEKATNGIDADEPSGPSIVAGEQVTWTYVVTNTGNVPLVNVVVTDNMEGTITCPKDVLAEGESMTCTANGTAEPFPYANEGKATGDYNGTTVEDSDPSHYTGTPGGPGFPGIDIEKSTNGYDADIPTGPTILAGRPIEWRYEVTNIGNVPLANVVVTDDKGVAVTCPQDVLEIGASMTCTADGTAVTAQYANLGTVSGDWVVDGVIVQTIQDTDPSHYFGADPAIDIEKSTQGFDADTATGPFIEVGDIVYWLYSVKNTGNVDLTNVSVTDNQGEVLDCGGGEGDNVIESLPVGDTKTCQALGIALTGQYWNLGTAQSTYTDDEGNEEPVTDEDPSHYFGAEPGIDIEKCTSGDALDNGCGSNSSYNHDNPFGEFFVEGDEVIWTYTITNTGNVALTNVTVSDDQGAVLDCGTFDGTLDPNDVLTCTAGDTAVLGQYANEGYASGEYTVSVGSDGTSQTRTAEDVDPSHYYGFDKSQPSLEVSVTDFDVTGELNQFLNGAFVLENASGDPSVTAIGVQSIDFTIEYRSKGKGWTNVDVNGTCTTDPVSPFVFEGDGEWSETPGTQEVTFSCTAEENEIPDDYTSIRATVCVEIFNRYDRSASKKAGEDIPMIFCSKSEMDETP